MQPFPPQIPPPFDYDESGAPTPTPYGELPPSLTEQQLKFLNLPDDVPDHLRERLWGLFTRHSELSNIFDTGELNRARRRVRLICRPMMWANSSQKRVGDISFLERMQIEHMADLLLRKSYKQQERRLLAPWLQEMTSKAEINEQNRARSHGFFGRGLNAIFGGRG
jgi:hemoglobin-like flavoprotein